MLKKEESKASRLGANRQDATSRCSLINSAHDNLNSKQLLGQGDIPELSIRKEPLLRESSSLLPAQLLQPPKSHSPRMQNDPAARGEGTQSRFPPSIAEGAGLAPSSSTRGGFAHPWSKVGPKNSHQTNWPLIKMQTLKCFLWMKALPEPLTQQHPPAPGLGGPWCSPHLPRSCSTRRVLQSPCRDLFYALWTPRSAALDRSADWFFFVTSREGAANTPLRFEHLNELPLPINFKGISTGRKGIHRDCSPWWFHFRGSFRFMLEHKQWPVTSAKDIKRNEAEKIRESPLFHALYNTNNKSFSQLRTCKRSLSTRTCV